MVWLGRVSAIAVLAAAGAVAILWMLGSESAKQTVTSGYGPAPVLPPPVRTLIPTIDIASAKAWPVGATPKAPPGFNVSALATGLDHPRWLCVLPNGDVLVAETNGPKHTEGNGFTLRGLPSAG